MDEGAISAIVADCKRLYEEGSSSATLNTCVAILSLGPIRKVEAKGLPNAVAAFTLLRLVATNPQETYEVAAAGALTGIEPRNVSGGGARGRPGQGLRKIAAHKNYLASISNSRGERLNVEAPNVEPGILAENTRYNSVSKRKEAYRAYAIAILEYSDRVGKSNGGLDSFIKVCRNDYRNAPGLEVEAERSVGPGSANRDLVSPSSIGLAALRSVPLTGTVQAALESVLVACSAKQRAVYTSDVLLALLDMPDGRVATCFDEIELGLARKTRTWLLREFGQMATGTHPYRPFDWAERPEIRSAQQLALADEGVVTDAHVLAAILDGRSVTKTALVELLGSNFYRLQVTARRTSHDPLPVLKTPRGKADFFN